MDVKSLHYSFKLAMDRLDKASSEDFNPAEIDWLLTEAQLVFIKQRFSALSNQKQKGFEASQKRIDDLGTLHIKYPSQPLIVPSNIDGIYEVPLSTPTLAYDYLFLSRGSAKTKLGKCYYTPYLKFAQSDDLSTMLKDPFNSPGEEFLLYNIGRSTSGDGSSLYIYPGTYEVKEVYLDYIKYPKRVNLGTYTYIDGTVSVEQTLETPPQTHQEIVDIAAQLASISIEDPRYLQLKNSKLIIHE